MATAVAPVIDSLKAAREKQQFAGHLRVASLARLADMMVPHGNEGNEGNEGDGDDSGSLDYVVSGDEDRQNRPQLHVKVDGRLNLQCQRCMGELPYDIAIDSVLRLVPAGISAASGALEVEQDGDPEAPDCIAASAQLDVAALVEDEVLLALPPYPMHEAGRCKGSRAGEGTKEANGTIAGEPARSGQPASTFGALAALKHKS